MLRHSHFARRAGTWAAVVTGMVAAVAICASATEPSTPPAPGPEPAPMPPAATQASPATQSGLGAWTIREADRHLLAAAFSIGRFEICPPAGFRFIKQAALANTSYWVGPIRADETYPQFFVLIERVPRRNTRIEDAYRQVLEGVKGHRTNWSATPEEIGKINGLAFARGECQGLVTDTARKGLAGRLMHNLIYVTIQGDDVVTIMCQDVGADYGQWLKLGGLAASTFRVGPGLKASTSAPAGP